MTNAKVDAARKANGSRGVDGAVMSVETVGPMKTALYTMRSMGERGEAVAGFALTAALTTLVFLIVMQFGYFLYTKAVLIDAAGQGARVAARHQGTNEQGITRTKELLVPVTGTQRVVAIRRQTGSTQTVQISVSSQFPLLGPYGIPGLLNATGNALVETYEETP